MTPPKAITERLQYLFVDGESIHSSIDSANLAFQLVPESIDYSINLALQQGIPGLAKTKIQKYLRCHDNKESHSDSIDPVILKYRDKLQKSRGKHQLTKIDLINTSSGSEIDEVSSSLHNRNE